MYIYDDILDFDDNDELTVEFSSVLSNLSKEKIKKIEVDYRFNTVVSLSCPLSMYMSGKWKETKPYELIFEPYHKNYFIAEGLIKTIEPETVKRILLKYSNKTVCDSLFTPNWLQTLYMTSDNAKEQMLDYFPLIEEQIRIVETKSGIKYIMIIVPNIGENITLVKKYLEKFGYFCSTPDSKGKDILNDKIYWTTLQFEPHHQEIITELLKKEHKFLYHVSPTKYEHKILKNGLCPLSKNDNFVYPSRVYMMMDYRKIGNEIKIATLDYMELVAKTLLSAKIKSHSFKEDEYVNDYDWTCYSIDISKLKDNFIASYDANFYPLAIFAAENIQPDAIKIIRRFNLKNAFE